MYSPPGASSNWAPSTSGPVVGTASAPTSSTFPSGDANAHDDGGGGWSMRSWVVALQSGRMEA